MPLFLTDNPTNADLAAIEDVLVAHLEAHAGPFVKTPIAVIERDEHGEFVGGLGGATYLGWLYVEILAVAEAHRGHGVGSRLLLAAEAEAMRRGCTHAYLDTFSFQARPFYERHGYIVAGTLNDFPAGHARFFLQKRLAPDAAIFDCRTRRRHPRPRRSRLPA